MKTNIGLVLLAGFAAVAWAEVPQVMSYQGRITVTGGPYTGSGQFRFALVATNGTTLWSNDGSSINGTAPVAAVPLAVDRGLYSVLLGDTNLVNMTVPIGPNSLSVPDVRLRLWFDDGVHGVQQLAPDQKLGSAGFALVASTATTATTAGSATTAASFTGPLAGDVGGTQGATVVELVGGVSAANVAAGANLANAGTALNTPDTLVKRDGRGNFAAGTITAASLTGDGAGLTALNAGALATGTVPDARLSGNLARLDGTNTFTGTNLFAGVTEATNAANAFTGTFTGDLLGNATTATTATTAGSATTAASFTGPLAGDVSGPQGATVVELVGGVSAANVAAGANLANAGTSLNTPDTLVRRDGSGSFAAGTITAASLAGDGAGLTALNAGSLATGTVADARLSPNVARLDGTNVFGGTNLFAGVTLATNAANEFIGTFTGELLGNAATATSAANFTGGLAANVIAGANLANAATNLNQANRLVKRDGSGNFAAGTITANLVGNVTGNLSGNATTATTATTATNALNVGGVTAASVATGANLANAATTTNGPNTIVRRNGSGNFTAGTITANLVGNVTGSLSGNATTATTATNALNVGGVTAANVATGANLANAATALNTANTLVKRDASGNFTAGTITANLTGTATNALNVGGVTAANVAAGANLANAATALNTASTIVRRDASGNFTAGTITANLTGNLTGNLDLGTLSRSAASTLLDTDNQVVFVNANAGAVTITLPPASATTVGRVYRIYKTDASANAVTVAGDVGDTVNGTTSTTVRWQFLDIIGFSSTSWIARAL
jgi:hypothetical protein